MLALRGIFNSYAAPPSPEVSFQDKNIIVTGGNTGLGLEAAVKFVNSGATRVIITTRDMEKGLAAKAWISERTSKGDSVEVWQLDMNSYDSIRSFCEKASSELNRLDVVVLNAAIAPRHSFAVFDRLGVNNTNQFAFDSSSCFAAFAEASLLDYIRQHSHT